jgi:hypothetical protein
MSCAATDTDFTTTYTLAGGAMAVLPTYPAGFILSPLEEALQNYADGFDRSLANQARISCL